VADIRASNGDDLPGVRDTRTAEVRKYDAICDQVIAMNELVKELVDKIPQGQTQTVLYKSHGMGVIGAVCATVCVMCVLVVILGAIIFVPEIHDLRAWQDINRKDIARLQAQLLEKTK
jgi:ABC-type uncharacterized transport system ATPase subunit